MTEKFLESIYSIERAGIPPSTYDQARFCLLDYIACAVAGAKIYSAKEQEYLKAVYPESGVSSVLGHHITSTMQTAAFINGMSAHAVELDDGHRIGMMHPGAPVISALLAVAEKECISSADFLYGIIIGYEVSIRLACAIQPSCKLKGFHATGICGVIGGAMAISVALGFNMIQMKSTFSAAVTSASGILEMIEGDTELKPFNAGNAAMCAVSAAYVGKCCFKSPKDPLGGKRGFLRVFGEDVRMEYLTRHEGDKYCIDTIYNKPYASCRHTHPAIEGAMQIRRQPGFKIEDISSIQVDTYRLAVAGHDHTSIEGVNSAKMSIPYSVAVALMTGKAGLYEFSEKTVENTAILELASKVKVADREEFSALCPGKRVAEVNVNADGKVFSTKIEYPKGEPENPLSSAEFIQKFNGLMAFAGYPKSVSEECVSLVERADFEISEVIRLL